MFRLKRIRAGVIVSLLTMILLVSGMTALFAAVPENEVISSVAVGGNSTVAESAILGVVKIKPGDKVNAEAVKKDLQGIFELGHFFDVSAEFVKQENGVKVIYQVVENPGVKEIVIKGNKAVPTEKITELLKNVPGPLLNSKTLSQSVKELEKYYHDQGYILAKVSDVAIGSGGVLTITINEGLLEGVTVKGNEKTKEYVITREMVVKPGESFNVKDARRSMQKVYNLGYFEDVNMKLNPGKEPNGVILETDVKEQKTASAGIGGGYSSADGLIGFIELGDNNFRGTGDQVKVHWEFGADTGANNYSLGITRPWLDKKQTSLSFNFYNMTRERDEYLENNNDVLNTTFDEQRKGWNITIGRPHGEYLKNYLTFKNETVNNRGLVEGAVNQPIGPFGTTHSVQLQSIWDTRDNVFNATTGERVSLSTEIAGGPLGGDFDFQKYQAEARKYIKAGGKQVWAFRVGAGLSAGELPSSEQFTLGGSNNLRGYDDDKLKGEQMLNVSAEYRFPFGSKMQGVGFVDAGSVKSLGYDLGDVKASVGLGLRLTTPLGPLRLDYGVGEDGGKFHFSIGSTF